MHGRSCITIDARILALSEMSTSAFHRQGGEGGWTKNTHTHTPPPWTPTRTSPTTSNTVNSNIKNSSNSEQHEHLNKSQETNKNNTKHQHHVQHKTTPSTATFPNKVNSNIITDVQQYEPIKTHESLSYQPPHSNKQRHPRQPSQQSQQQHHHRRPTLTKPIKTHESFLSTNEKRVDT